VLSPTLSMAEQAYHHQAAGLKPYAGYAGYSAAWPFSHQPANGAHPAYGSQPQAGGQALYRQTPETSSCPPSSFPAITQARGGRRPSTTEASTMKEAWGGHLPSMREASTMTSQEHSPFGSAPLHATAKGSSGESFLPLPTPCCAPP